MSIRRSRLRSVSRSAKLRCRPHPGAAVLALAASLALAAPAAAASGRSCEESVRAVAAGAENAADVCKRLHMHGAPGARSHFEERYAFEAQPLGDGSDGYVLREKSAGDQASYREDLHYVLDGGRLRLVYDGRGVASRYATDRPKVNGRWQIERVTEADTPVYRKREAEVWFWDGREYARAFSQSTFVYAKDKKRTSSFDWNEETKQAYIDAGNAWTYTIVAGDTLGAIARRKGVPQSEILKQNPQVNPAALRIGQKLRYESWRVGG